jgi:hypothetical protein
MMGGKKGWVAPTPPCRPSRATRISTAMATPISAANAQRMADGGTAGISQALISP